MNLADAKKIEGIKAVLENSKEVLEEVAKAEKELAPSVESEIVVGLLDEAVEKLNSAIGTLEEI